MYCEKGHAKATALALDLSVQTIKNHLYEARKRTGTVSTAQLCYLLGSGDLEQYVPRPEDEDDNS